ncbi:unnamed protein product [Anisakis simplex]|uniref:Activin_recp domain-containing protein n=1 Tax=Anisakis simplex TaxID=6269 RepID=A0A0M3JI13_ANISI|nr:unnamed protein product [Anisakis simplex]
MGYCGDVCPAIFQSQPCVYQEGGQNFALLNQMTGSPSATVVCCCDNDLCNGVRSMMNAKLCLIWLIVALDLVVLLDYFN